MEVPILAGTSIPVVLPVAILSTGGSWLGRNLDELSCRERVVAGGYTVAERDEAHAIRVGESCSVLSHSSEKLRGTRSLMDVGHAQPVCCFCHGES